MDRVKEILSNYDQNFILKDKQREYFKYLLEGKGDLGVVPVGYGKSVDYHLLQQLLGEQPRHGQKPRTKAKRTPWCCVSSEPYTIRPSVTISILQTFCS